MNLRLGYLVPEFPGQTHVMMWREVRALRRMGEDVFLLSTRKPRPMTCHHDFVPTAIAQTRYLFPPVVSSWVAWTAAGCPGLRQARAYLGGLEPLEFKGRMRLYGLLASAVDLARWARLERIDHIHGHSCADAAHVLALARRMGGPPYSLTLHGDLKVYGTDHGSKMEGAAFVCVVGNHLRRQVLDQTNVSGNRVFVTCMGVETSALTALGRDRSYTPGSLHLVTVARLNAAKGHVHALAAIHRGLQAGLDLHYTIAGEGPHRDALLSVIDELGLGSHVTLTGALPEAEVFQLLSKADAFVLPSVGFGEAWPVSVMEAMGAGLPVIASMIGATPEMITPGGDGFLIPQRDERALLENIVLLARDVDTRRRIGEAARRTAERRFDVRETAGALRDAARASLEGGQGGHRNLRGFVTSDRVL
jgi:colanic acid/amylovoran biosynthesis glycosyltransferase